MNGNDTITALGCGRALITNDNSTIIKMVDGKLHKLVPASWVETKIDFNQLLALEMIEVESDRLTFSLSNPSKWSIIEQIIEEVAPVKEEVQADPAPIQEEEEQPTPELRDFPELAQSKPISYEKLDAPKKMTKAEKMEHLEKRIIQILTINNNIPMGTTPIAKEVFSGTSKAFDRIGSKERTNLIVNIRYKLNAMVENGTLSAKKEGKRMLYFIL